MTNPQKPIQELIEAHKIIRAIWNDEHTRTNFSEAWGSFSEHQRRAIAKEVAPRIPESTENASMTIDGETVDMSEFAALFPELCTANLIKDKTLLNIFESLATPGTFSAAAFEQMMVLRLRIMQGHLKVTPVFGYTFILNILVDEEFGKIIRLVPQTEPNHEEANKEALEMKTNAHAIPPWEFDMLLTRLKFLIQHSLLLFNAVKKTALREGGCWTCGKPTCDDGAKLLKCVKCGTAQYCSRDCQVKNWKEGHKTECSSLAQKD
ncbi:hypothetical protein BDR26DRAFT_226676 [Obelidium mucronatum]|nr:hypothetical protein BDR26DRAFT_226676 [Obelidium mucronatum]